jgi:DNA-binding beta-propeller fold protein YncE
LTFTPTVTRTVTPSRTVTKTRTPHPTISSSPTLVPTISFTPNPLDGPMYIALFRATGNLWVASRNNSSLIELDGNDLHVVSTMIVDSPSGIAIWQDKGLAYVSNQDYNTVTEISLYDHSILRKINVEKQPRGVTVAQSTGDVYVANYGSNNVSCIPANGSSVSNTSGQSVVLDHPARLVGFRLNDNYPGAAMVVDASGQVAVVALTSYTLGLPPTSDIYTKPNPCAIFLLTNLNKEALADVDQSYNNNPMTFFISDIDAKSVELVPLDMATRDKSVIAASRVALPKAPYAIANMGQCVGAVVPSQNRLYLLDVGISQIIGQKDIGKQGKNGGWGLVYNPDNNTAYVTNFDGNSVTRIETPCQ